MRRRFMVAVFGTFGRLPRSWRRVIIRAASPKYTVGSLCIVQRDDGAVLLVRHSYNRRWGTVGGLAKRGEAPDVAAVREAKEEAGIEVVVVGEPAVVVLAHLHRVDVVYLTRPAPSPTQLEARPTSAEILEVRWFPAGELPELSADTASAWAALSRRGDLAPPGVA